MLIISHWFIEKIFGHIQNNSFKLGMMTDIIELQCLIPIKCHWPSYKVEMKWENKSSFSCQFWIDLEQITYVAMACSVVEAGADLLNTIVNQGRFDPMFL